jgi:radical SAM superfamily enzyme YgiQ (UPF0313 family)
MYKDIRFSIESIDQIEKDIIEAKSLYGNVKRIFLVNGDAFVLSANKLKPIAELIKKHIPSVEVITMYASVNNIKGKTDEQLIELQKLGIDELWVGAETGDAETLKMLNKGFTIDETYKQLERLNKAKIKFYYGFMFGVAGKNKGIDNAIANAKIINQLKPYGIVPTTLGAFGDSDLAKQVEEGNFEPANEHEVLQEQKKLLELIEVETFYMGIHGLNPISFDAHLQKEKSQAIQRINNTIERMGDAYLKSVPLRKSV